MEISATMEWPFSASVVFCSLGTQAFPAMKVFTHAQLITRLYVAGKAWVPRLRFLYTVCVYCTILCGYAKIRLTCTACYVFEGDIYRSR